MLTSSLPNSQLPVPTILLCSVSGDIYHCRRSVQVVVQSGRHRQTEDVEDGDRAAQGDRRQRRDHLREDGDPPGVDAGGSGDGKEAFVKCKLDLFAEMARAYEQEFFQFLEIEHDGKGGGGE